MNLILEYPISTLLTYLKSISPFTLMYFFGISNLLFIFTALLYPYSLPKKYSVAEENSGESPYSQVKCGKMRLSDQLCQTRGHWAAVKYTHRPQLWSSLLFSTCTLGQAVHSQQQKYLAAPSTELQV